MCNLGVFQEKTTYSNNSMFEQQQKQSLILPNFLVILKLPLTKKSIVHSCYTYFHIHAYSVNVESRWHFVQFLSFVLCGKCHALPL